MRKQTWTIKIYTVATFDIDFIINLIKAQGHRAVAHLRSPSRPFCRFCGILVRHVFCLYGKNHENSCVPAFGRSRHKSYWVGSQCLSDEMDIL